MQKLCSLRNSGAAVSTKGQGWRIKSSYSCMYDDGLRDLFKDFHCNHYGDMEFAEHKVYQVLHLQATNPENGFLFCYPYSLPHSIGCTYTLGF